MSRRQRDKAKQAKQAGGKNRGPSSALWLIAAVGAAALVLVTGSILSRRAALKLAESDRTSSAANVLPQLAPPATNSGPPEVTLPETTDPTELSSQATQLLNAGNAQGAIRLYQRALESSPEDEDLHFNLGVAYARVGAATNAEHHYREALRLLPDYPEVHNNLGNLLLSVGRVEEAEKHLQESVNLMPEYANAQNNLGVLRQKQSRPAEALECFKKAVQLDTNYWQAQFNLGNAYMQHGNAGQAVRAFREVLRINPDYKPANEALARALKPPGPK